MSQLSKQNYDVQCSDSRAKKSYYQILVPVVFYIYVVKWCSVPEINNGLCRHDEMNMVFFNFFPFWMIVQSFAISYRCTLIWKIIKGSNLLPILGTQHHHYLYILPRLHKSGSFSSLDICKFVAISTKRLKSTGKIDEAKNSCHSSITLVWVVHDTNRHTWCTNAQTDWANFEHWKKKND